MKNDYKIGQTYYSLLFTIFNQQFKFKLGLLIQNSITMFRK